MSGSHNALLGIADGIMSAHPAIRCSDSAAGILDAARAAGADVIFPSMVPLGDSRIPWVGYVFDFQHVHMPHFFSEKERLRRDGEFRRIADGADAIVVNSAVVARDVVLHLGVPESRVLHIPFCPYVQPQGLAIDPTHAIAKYGVGARYVMVCNHFWMHKDHPTALRAFALLREQYPDMKLVLTGDPVDHRDPRYFSRVLALAESLGIADATRFLGLIPKQEQLALLRGASALVQPTLYEGGPGGGAVYDAVGLGIPAVVSNIPINLEIDADGVTFFEAGDFADLAEKLDASLRAQHPASTHEELLAHGRARLSHAGRAMYDFLAHMKHNHEEAGAH